MDPVGEVTSALSPTCVTIRRGTSGAVEDSLLASDLSTKNHGASAALSMGVAGSGGTREALIKWDTSGIPSTALVTSATATFTTAVYSGGPLEVHQVLAPWSEATVSWGSFNQAFAPAVTATMTGSVGSNTASLTALAQGWIDGSTLNAGILITRPGTSVTNFNSSEATTVAQRPSLQVCYVTNPCSANPCQNGGTCTPDAAGSGAYTCDCPMGFSGATCQTNVCAGVVCAPVDACHAAGVCNPATGQCDVGSPLGDTTTGLGHHWTFDEPSGSTAIDSSGTSNGTLGSSASRWTSFDGSGAVLFTPHGSCDKQAEVDFGSAPGAFGTSDFSVSFWVATNFSKGTNGDLIGNRVAGSGGDFLSGRFLPNHGTVSIEIDDSANHYNATSSSPTTINDGTWHNIVYTRSGATLAMYVDGALTNSSTGTTVANIVGAAPFKLGRSLPLCLGGFESIAAQFDDVRIYDRALGTCDLSLLAGTSAGTPAAFPPPPPPSCPCTGDPAWEYLVSTAAEECNLGSDYLEFYRDGYESGAYVTTDPAGNGECYAYSADGGYVDYNGLSPADSALCLAQAQAVACP